MKNIWRNSAFIGTPFMVLFLISTYDKYQQGEIGTYLISALLVGIIFTVAGALVLYLIALISALLSKTKIATENLAKLGNKKADAKYEMWLEKQNIKLSKAKQKEEAITDLARLENERRIATLKAEIEIQNQRARKASTQKPKPKTK